MRARNISSPCDTKHTALLLFAAFAAMGRPPLAGLSVTSFLTHFYYTYLRTLLKEGTCCSHSHEPEGAAKEVGARDSIELRDGYNGCDTLVCIRSDLLPYGTGSCTFSVRISVAPRNLGALTT